MKQYLLSVVHETATYPDIATATGPEFDAIGRDVNAVNEEMRAKGAWVFAGGLHPVGTATTLRPQNGEVVMTDGPYAESKECIGGFWVVRAADLDEALAWGRKATLACRVPVEVRPFHDEAPDA